MGGFPTTPSSGADPTLAGDATGPAGSNTVVGLDGNALDSAGARTALGLGSAAVEAATAFDAAGAAAAAQAASQPLDADLTALAGANNSSVLTPIGAAAQALATSGAVTFNPATGNYGYILQSGNVTSITLTAPTKPGMPAYLLLVGDGSHSWPATIVNVSFAGGTFTAPVGSAANLYEFVSVTAPGSPGWACTSTVVAVA